MKKLFLLFFLLPLFATAQQTYFTPGVPPGTTSFTPSFRYKAVGTDSLNNLYIAIGNKTYQFPTYPQIPTLRFDSTYFTLTSNKVSIKKDTLTHFNKLMLQNDSGAFVAFANGYYDNVAHQLDFVGVVNLASTVKIGYAPIQTGRSYFVKIDSATGQVVSDTARHNGGVGGSNKQIQFNDSGVLNGSSAALFDKATGSTYLNVTLPSSSAPTGNIIYVYGDSIGAGAVATDTLHDYANLIAKQLNCSLRNYSVSGTTLEKRSPLNPTGGTNMIDELSLIHTYNATADRLAIIQLGVNDWQYGGTNYNPTNYATDYNTVMNAFVSAGWPMSKVMIVTIGYVDPALFGTPGAGGLTRTLSGLQAFNTAGQGVATSFGCPYFDPYTYMANRGAIILMYNSLHPNNLGHFQISRGVLSTLGNTIYQTGQTQADNGKVEFNQLFLQKYISSPFGKGIPIGLDSTNQIRPLSDLPYAFPLNYPTFETGLYQANAVIPTTLSGNDILLKRDTKITEAFDIDTYNSIQVSDVGANMNFYTNFSNAKYRFYNVNGLAFQIERDGSISTAGGTAISSVGHVIGDLYVPSGAGITSDVEGSTNAFGAFQPFDVLGNTDIRNTFHNGQIKTYVSGGSDGGVLLATSLLSTGHFQGYLQPTDHSNDFARMREIDSLITASGGGTSYTAGYGLSLVGSQFKVDSTVIRAKNNNYFGLLAITNTGGSGYLDLPLQSTSPAASTNHLRIYPDSLNRLSWKNSTYRRTIQVPYPSDYTIRMPYSVTGTTLEDSTHAVTTYYLASNPSNYFAKTGLSATTPLSYNSTTGVFTIQQGSASQPGYISSTDWSTFNGKQATGNYITALAGDATASGPGSAALTLATVNSNVGSFNNFTVNAKGLITAASTVAYLIGNQTITLTGDVTGSGATSIASTLKNTGTAGTYGQATFDAQGRETAGQTVTDIAHGGTNSATQNFVDLTTNQTITTGHKTWTQDQNFNGRLLMGASIIPTVNQTDSLGTASLMWAQIYSNTMSTSFFKGIGTGGGFSITTGGTTGDITYSLNSTSTTIAKMYNTTGDIMFQKGGTFVDSTAYRLNVVGRMRISQFTPGSSNDSLMVFNPTTHAVRMTKLVAGTNTTIAYGSGTVTINGGVNSPITQSSADLTAQTSAGNITTFTVGASTATFSISGYINITAVTVDVIELQVTYTDENSTSQTANFFTQGATSALLSAIGNSVYPPMTIRAKNGTVITVKTTLTTGTGSITYDSGGRIQQL